MKPKVFVSSTIYDLLDIREELEVLLREMNCDPFLSESATSEFQVCPDRNAIETCLTNVRSSDFVIVILSRRYGPSLAPAGYEDLSATHLEYRTAIAERRHVLFYVRDRLDSELAVWRKNKGQVNLTWVTEAKDHRLFEFIDEHKTLKAEDSISNWYQTFRTSVDLKDLVARDLRGPASKAALERAIREDHIPLFRGSVNVMHNTPAPGKFMTTFEFTNMGRVPAYNVLPRWGADKPDPGEVWPVIAPQDSITQQMSCDLPSFSQRCLLQYHTPEGHVVLDTFNCFVEIGGGATKTFVKLAAKEFKAGENLPIVIQAS